MASSTGKSAVRRKQQCTAANAVVSNTDSAKTNERLQEFIGYFVKEFEGKLLLYRLISEGESEHSGKYTEIFSKLIGQGAGGAVKGIVTSSFDSSQALGSALGKVTEKAVETLCRELGNSKHLKKIICLSDLIDRSQKDKANFRKTLVEAGLDIFQSFEMQFMRVATDKGPRDAIHNLAKDAVDRAINYIKIKEDALISEGVILGKSAPEATGKLFLGNTRPGFKITYEYQSRKKNWYTADLYAKVGLAVTPGHKTAFYKKKDSTSNTPEYGYRRLFTWENWNDLKEKYLPDNAEEKKCREFREYKHVLSATDLDMKLESVLKKINDCDKDLAEERIKELLIEVRRDVIEEVINRPEYVEFREILANIEASLGNEILKVDELLEKFKRCLEEAKEERKETTDFMREGFQDASQQRQKIGDDSKREHEKTQAELEKVNENIKKVQKKQKRSKNILVKNKKSIERVEKNQLELNKSVRTFLGKLQSKEKERVFKVRESVKSFTGRQKELDQLASGIGKYGTFVICGLSGVGKSELAIKYARNQYSKEGSVIWINAGSRDTVKQSFQGLYRSLGYSIKCEDGEEKDIKSIAEDVYAEFSDRKSLFIFDDAENYEKIRDVLPLDLDPKLSKPYVLITSNNLGIMAEEKLCLGDFAPTDSVDFIRNSLGIKDESQNKEILELAKILHNFPLALQQAVSFITQQEDQFTISKYLKEYGKKTEFLLSYEPFRRIDSYYDKTTFTALEMTLDKIKDHKCDGRAFEILYMMAYLAPDSIPSKMFLEYVQNDERSLGSFIQLLKKYSVVRYEKTLLNIHGLVQQILKIKLQGEMRDGNSVEETILDKTLQLLKKNMADFKSLQNYTPHIISVWNHAFKYDTLIEKFIYRDLVGDKETCTTYFHLIAEGNRYEVVQHVVSRIEEKYPDDLDKLINQENSGKSTPLHSAALSGDEKTVRLLINKGADVNAVGKHKWTPLHFAAKNGYLETVNILLRKDAYINAATEYKFTPLHLAVKGNYVAVVNVLLSKGADVNAKTSRGFTPLHFAVDNDCTGVVRTLLDYKACEDDRTRHEYTLLHLAAKGGCTKVVNLLLERRENIEAKTRLKFTPLLFAAENGDLSTVQALLSKACEDDKTRHEYTLLHLAAKGGRTKVVNLLLERGENIEAKTRLKFTPLHFAAENGNLSTVQALLSKNAAVNVKDANQFTPLHLAAMKGHTSVVNILINRNAEIDAETTRGSTPLHFAAENGHLEVYNMLIARGANVQAKTHLQSTLLHLASGNGHLSIVQDLVSRGATVDAKDENLFTPLHLAAMNGHTPVVIFLLDQNAEINAVTTTGNTPLLLAAEKGHLKVYSTLISRGADVQAQTHLKSTLLHLAAQNGHLSIVEDLLRREAAVDAKDENHFTPLHLAAMNGHTAVVSTLLSENARIYLETIEGNTPLHLAAENGHLKVFEALLAGGADDEAKTRLKSTVLHLAARNGHLSIVKELLSRSVMVDVKDNNSYTALHAAAVNGNVDVVNALLSQTGNINAKTTEGNTPLHLAAERGHLKIVKALIAKKADASIKNMESKTALDLAIEKNHLEIKVYLTELNQINIEVV